jgi:hypothetical protein
MSFHLAQVNIARMRFEMGAPEMSGLSSRIEEINRLADGSRGFVWRLPGAEATPAALRALDGYFVPFDAERLFYNLSVWESVEHLHDYVYGSSHRELLRGKHEWIAAFERPAVALWWVPIGHRPTIVESGERLHALEERGPSAHAFTFARRFPPPSV